MLDSATAMAFIEPLIFGASLVMMRIIGVVVVLPGMSSGQLPVPTRTLFVMFLTVFIWSAMGMPMVAVPEQPVTAGILVIREFVLGSAMGLVIRLFFAIADVTGAIAGMAIALSMAGMVDPATGEQTTAISNLLALGGLLIFVALGGHEQVLAGLLQNFDRYPLGMRTLVSLDSKALQTLGAGMIGAAVRIAAPIVIVANLINVGLGLMARAAPQVNIFAIGFSVLLIGGLLVLEATVFELQETYSERIPTLAAEMNNHLVNMKE